MVSEFEFLNKGLTTGGRIASQSAESVWKELLPFRRLGPVRGILWLIVHFNGKIEREAKELTLWVNTRRQSTCPWLSRHFSEIFVKLVEVSSRSSYSR